MSVADAVTAELERLPGKMAESGLAASALALAESIDDSACRPTAKAMCARELRETLTLLHKLAPAEPKADRIDDLAKRRASRRSAASG